MVGRRSLRGVVSGIAFLVSSLAFATSLHAESKAEEQKPPPRPIQYASVEINPLVLPFHRVSGQLQVGIYGPVSLVGSVSRIAIADSQHYSEYDETVFGNHRLEGWLFEIGPRFHLPLGTKYVYSWGQPSLLVDVVTQGPSLKCDGRDCQSNGVTSSARRTGVAFDAGFHFQILPVWYATVGLGISTKTAVNNFAADTSNSPLAAPDLYSRGTTNSRLLASFGVGF
jgi:hypothetical protein